MRNFLMLAALLGLACSDEEPIVPEPDMSTQDMPAEVDMPPDISEPVCEPVACNAVRWAFTPPTILVRNIYASDLEVGVRLEATSSFGGGITQNFVLTSDSEGPNHPINFPEGTFDEHDWHTLTVLNMKATQCDGMLYTFDPEFVYDFATEEVTIDCGRNP
jgi:hypothetical protein